MTNLNANAAMPDALPTADSLAGAGLQPVTAPVLPAGASVIEVGVGRAYTTIASALAASRDGDTLLVDAGTYVNDFAYVSTKVSIIGVGGMVNLVATVAPPNGKAILCVDADCTMQNLTFSGCRVPDLNGAGIRYEGGSLTLRNCAFHDNENGLMSAPVADGTLLIQHCDFGHNGNGNGLTHNLYAGGIKKLVVQDSRFHDAVVGHEIKSRAVTSVITGNVIADGPDSTASYSIDLPDGGTATVSGNLIEKGPNAENQSVIHFGGEGLPYAGSSLRVSGNSIVNDRGPGTTGVLNHTAIPAVITGNGFTRFDAGQVAAGPARETANTDEAGTLLPDTTLSGVLPGRTQVFTDDADHSVTFLGSDQAVQGGAGRLSVLAVAGHVIALGGAGGMDFTEGPESGGNQIGTAAGSSNTVTVRGQDSIDSEGADSITTGGGNVTAQVGGTAVIDEGMGNNQWSILGAATLTGHGGAPHINLGASASVAVDGALAFMALSNNGGNARYDIAIGGTRARADLQGGAFSMYVGGNGSASIITAGGGPGVQMRMGTGDAQIVSHGHDVIRAGSGATVVQAWNGAEVHAGSGAMSLYSRGLSGASLYGNGGSYLISGDTGGITYYGGDRDSTVQADLSNITLLGGAGRMTVHAGARQTITGGTGGLTLTEGTDSGANHITTLAGTTNQIAANNDTVESWGEDTITVGAANTRLAVHGTAQVQGGPGNSTLLVTGRATLAGVGGDWVTLAQGAEATVQAGAYLSVQETAATLRLAVPGTSGTALVQGGTAGVLVDSSRVMHVTTGPGPDAHVSVDGGDAVIDTWGATQVHTGAGTATVNLCAADSDVWAGAGQTKVNYWVGDGRQTIHGGAGTVHVSNNGGVITYAGGDGDAELDGAGTHLTVQGGAGAITLNRAYGGPVTFTGGSGGATLNLGNGGGDITFGQGRTDVSELGWGDAVAYTASAATRGTQVISGFRVGTDVLQLQGTRVASQAIADGATVITTTDGARIVLHGLAQGVDVPQAVPSTDPGSPGAGLVLGISEDAWQGHAQYTVSIDGQQIGGVRTASASHAQGSSEAVAIPTALQPGAHRIGVTLLNDAWGGSADTDRNLYLDTAALNGTTVQAAVLPLYRNETAYFSLIAPALPAPGPAGAALVASHAVAKAQPAPAAAPFTVIDTATGQAQHSEGDAYAGPVAQLQRQFIWSGTGGVVVAASTPDVFLHGGTGDDALSAMSGVNVLDGGAGSNFLVGAAGADGGADTFFIDGRSGVTWSTVVNFHHGDAVTVWGFQAGASTLAWAGNEGAAGYQGATLHSELAGAGTGITGSATFAGLSLADVQSKLTTTTGTIGGTAYMNIAYTG